jgi:hypothetical protein
LDRIQGSLIASFLKKTVYKLHLTWYNINIRLVNKNLEVDGMNKPSLVVGKTYVLSNEVQYDSISSLKLVLKDYDYSDKKVEKIIKQLESKGFISNNGLVFPKGAKFIRTQEPDSFQQLESITMKPEGVDHEFEFCYQEDNLDELFVEPVGLTKDDMEELTYQFRIMKQFLDSVPAEHQATVSYLPQIFRTIDDAKRRMEQIEEILSKQ